MDRNRAFAVHALRTAVVLAMLGLLLVGGAEAATITVNAGGGAMYTKIQDAINASNYGDTINVSAGTYNENIVVNRSVIIIGADAGVTFINAANPYDHVVIISANSVNISGFTIKGAVADYKAGIYLYGVNYTNISNTKATNNVYGIYLYLSSNNTLSGNNASNNSYGIWLDSSTNNTLSGNNASNNYHGIDLYYSSNSTLSENIINSNKGIGIDLYYSSNTVLSNNIMIGNKLNFALSGNSDSNFDNHIDSSNLVDGKPIYYIKNAVDIIYDSSTSAGTFYCIGCENVTLKDMDLNNNSAGIYFWKTNNSRIQNVNASNNSYGIYLKYSSNNTIYNNYFKNTNNFYYSGTIINYYNTTKTAGLNIHGAPYLGGNFWANPSGTGFSQTCADTNRDGICDSSYMLASGNVDYLPLAATPPGYGYITGSVLYNSTGIAGSVVATNISVFTTTDTSGFYSFQLPAGTYQLTATCEPEYYPNSSIAITVVNGTTVVAQDINLIKKPTGNITGIVSLV